MKKMNAKILFSFTLIFLLCLSIGSIYAGELNEDTSNICTSSDVSDLEITVNSDIEDVSLDENSVEMKSGFEENLEYVDHNEENIQSNHEDSSNAVINNTNKLLSSDSSSNTMKVVEPEIWLMESDSKDAYVVEEISKYPNSNVVFHVRLSSYVENKYIGSVTLILDDKEYEAQIYNGRASISAKIPSKAGSYTATLIFSGGEVVIGSGGYRYEPNVSLFTLKVKKYPTVVSAPKFTAKHKKSKYFKVKIKNKITNSPLKNTKIILKIRTGGKYKKYKVKTNSKGIAKFNTKRLSVGTHKVIISSANKNYKIKKTSKIIIKKYKAKKHKYYVYKTKTKYITVKFGHNVQMFEEEKYTKKGWKLVKYWWGKKEYYDPMLGYWHMVYGKFKKTYKVKVAKYRYY